MISEQIVSSLKNHSSGALLMLSPGINVCSIINKFLSQYEHTNLNILLNFSQSELELIGNIVPIQKYNVEKRLEVYNQKINISVSPQILLTDLLTVLNPYKINGLIIKNAHLIQSDSNIEVFIINLVKIKKPQTFILAITNEPTQLKGQQNIENILRCLYINSVVCWPFNESRIALKIQKKWDEIELELSNDLSEMQMALKNLSEECIRELNRKTQNNLKTFQLLHNFDSEQTMEHQIYKDFIQIRKLLVLLPKVTRIQFYEKLEQAKQHEISQDSIWQVSDPYIESKVNKVSQLAKDRVFQLVDEQCKYVIEGKEIQLNYKLKIQLQPTLKFQYISEYIKDIQKIKRDNEIRLWIWSDNQQQCANIQHYLYTYFKLNDERNALNQMFMFKQYLFQYSKNTQELFQKYLNNPTPQQVEQKQKISIKNLHKSQKIDQQEQKQAEILLLNLLKQELDEYFRKWKEEAIQQIFKLSQHQNFEYQTLPTYLTQLDLSEHLQHIDDSGQFIGFQEDMLENIKIVVNSYQDRYLFKQQFKPTHILICEPDLVILREILLDEQQEESVKVLFLKQSFESEHFYKQKLDETDSFKLIVQYCQQKPIFNELPEDKIERFALNTRIGGLSSQEQVIIVDFREFRSELPAQLYYQGFKVIPLMLKTGDYILSNSCIVERKAIETGDLSESLLQKRLDDQLKRLHEYSHPFLLIEYSDKIRFNNKSLKQGYFQKDQQYQDNGLQILKRLFELTVRQYPKVQVLWSKNANYSARLLRELKKTIGMSTPDVEFFRKMQPKQEMIGE